MTLKTQYTNLLAAVSMVPYIVDGACLNMPKEGGKGIKSPSELHLSSNQIPKPAFLQQVQWNKSDVCETDSEGLITPVWEEMYKNALNEFEMSPEFGDIAICNMFLGAENIRCEPTEAFKDMQARVDYITAKSELIVGAPNEYLISDNEVPFIHRYIAWSLLFGIKNYDLINKLLEAHGDIENLIDGNKFSLGGTGNASDYKASTDRFSIFISENDDNNMYSPQTNTLLVSLKFLRGVPVLPWHEVLGHGLDDLHVVEGDNVIREFMTESQDPFGQSNPHHINGIPYGMSQEDATILQTFYDNLQFYSKEGLFTGPRASYAINAQREASHHSSSIPSTANTEAWGVLVEMTLQNELFGCENNLTTNFPLVHAVVKNFLEGERTNKKYSSQTFPYLVE